jgi:hypothetical protein
MRRIDALHLSIRFFYALLLVKEPDGALTRCVGGSSGDDVGATSRR